jgi:hypothetical protein
MSFRTCTPVSGLSQALALSVATVDNSRRLTQASTLFKSLAPLTPGLPEPVPQAVEPCPEAAAWSRNVEQFLQLLNAPTHNANPYNDHRFFAHARVLNGGWMDVPPGFAYHLAPGRADVGAGLNSAANSALVRRFAHLLGIAGFDERYPVLFDREGLILDGLHRLRACAQSGCRFYFLRLDF